VHFPFKQERDSWKKKKQDVLAAEFPVQAGCASCSANLEECVVGYVLIVESKARVYMKGHQLVLFKKLNSLLLPTLLLA